MMKKFFLLPVMFCMYGALQASESTLPEGTQAITPQRVAGHPGEELTAFLEKTAADLGLNSDTLRTQEEINRAIKRVHTALSMTYAEAVAREVEYLNLLEASHNARIEATQNEEERKTMSHQLENERFAIAERHEKATKLRNLRLNDIARAFVGRYLLQPTQAE